MLKCSPIFSRAEFHSFYVIVLLLLSMENAEEPPNRGKLKHDLCLEFACTLSCLHHAVPLSWR